MAAKLRYYTKCTAGRWTYRLTWRPMERPWGRIEIGPYLDRGPIEMERAESLIPLAPELQANTKRTFVLSYFLSTIHVFFRIYAGNSYFFEEKKLAIHIYSGRIRTISVEKLLKIQYFVPSRV